MSELGGSKRKTGKKRAGKGGAAGDGWPWDPARPVAGQFEEWVAKTDKFIADWEDSIVEDMQRDLDSTDSDAPTLAPTTPLLAIATAGVEELAAMSNDEWGRLRRTAVDRIAARHPGADAETVVAAIRDGLTAEMTAGVTSRPASLAATIADEMRRGIAVFVSSSLANAEPWICPVESQECAIRRECTNKCGPAEIEESLAHLESDPADSRVEVAITLGPPEDLETMIETADDTPIASGADHIGLTPRMVREHQAASDATEDAIREQTRHDVAASFVRHDWIRPNVDEDGDPIHRDDMLRNLRGEIEFEIIVGDEPAVVMSTGLSVELEDALVESGFIDREMLSWHAEPVDPPGGEK